MLNDVDRAVFASAAVAALAGLDVTAVQVGEVFDAGSSRSAVMRARAERRFEGPLDVVIKAPTRSTAGFVRERAALSLIDERSLPGAVRLLGCAEDPPLLVLEDLGDHDSVADLLLAGDPAAAERALVDWSVTVGALQAASVGLADAFNARLTTPVRFGTQRSAAAGSEATTDVLADWLVETATTLPRLLEPLGVVPGASAVAELQAITPALSARGTSAHGLVPGDTCPDNAVYVNGRLTLLDFEAAAHRHVAWEAAYLLVPWTTCWCSWAIPDQTTQLALNAWRQTVAPMIPAVTDARFEDHLATAVIAWTFVSLTFLISRALSDPGVTAPSRTAHGRPHPDLRSLTVHRMNLAATHTTSVLPALRDLAGEIHDACIKRWGQQTLQLAPAFRHNP